MFVHRTMLIRSFCWRTRASSSSTAKLGLKGVHRGRTKGFVVDLIGMRGILGAMREGHLQALGTLGRGQGAQHGTRIGTTTTCRRL